MPEFLHRTRSQGFAATEINIPELSESPKEIREDVPLTPIERFAQRSLNVAHFHDDLWRKD